MKLAIGKEDIEMYDPLKTWLVEDYRKELLERAEQRRLAMAATTTDHRPWQRLFARVGEVLIAAGTYLQWRFEPSACPDVEGSRVCC